MISFTAIAFCSLLALTGTGTGPITHTEIHPEKYAIINGDIVVGDGTKLNSGILLIEEGNIAFIGKNVRIPDIYEVIDATGKTVYPGFDQWEPYMEFSTNRRLKVPAGRLPDMVEQNGPLAVGETANLFIAAHSTDSTRVAIETIFIKGRILSKEQLDKHD